jgi:hypothetical protein
MNRLRLSRTRLACWAAAGLLAAIVVGAAFASAANVYVPASHAGMMTIPIPHGARNVVPPTVVTPASPAPQVSEAPSAGS